MPIIKSAIKRMKQTVVRRARNVTIKKELKTAVRMFLEKPSAAGFQAAQSEIDTAVKKNVLNKRTAARRKSQLVKVAKAAGVKPAASTKTKAVAKPAAAAAPKKAVAKTAAKPAAKKVAAKPAAKKPAAKKPAAKK